MPTLAIAAMGALLVAFVYEVNPQLGGPLLGLVLLALLGAAFASGSLKAAPQ